ncbi:hypothetical protein B0T21DRAFT_337169 [Apiosordaria backusii]|uniref:Uncharacterized protein n=1 Tax=Apiosordaria backusii TaxID=314023 RepID=A0AA40AX95_9PEZI|nr:hypothetical protein B0T21DRAFT_337169 [Apiosordaria backusii]
MAPDCDRADCFGVEQCYSSDNCDSLRVEQRRTAAPQSLILQQPQRPIPAIQEQALSFWPANDYGQPVLPDSVAQARYLTLLASYYQDLINHYQQREHKIAMITVPRPPGMSPNYQGNPSSIANQSADIDDRMNTSVSVTGLPPTIDVHGLLRCIRGFGRIKATVINGPDPNKGHTLSAAKIIFFDVEPAQRFLACYGPGSKDGGWLVQDRLARVLPNRIKVAQSDKPSNHSRVLVISGPEQYVSYESLEQIFASRAIEYQMDEVIPRPHKVEGWATIELRFGSYRGQASQAMMVVKRELRVFGIGGRFGVDPCA